MFLSINIICTRNLHHIVCLQWLEVFVAFLYSLSIYSIRIYYIQIMDSFSCTPNVAEYIEVEMWHYMIKVSLTRNHNQTLQTNPRYRKEEPKNTNSPKTKVKQPALSLSPIKIIAKLEGHEVLKNKPRTKYRPPHKQWEHQ